MLLNDFKIADADLESLKNYLREYITRPNRSLHIITFNTDFYYSTSINSEFQSICENSGLIVPDGYGITFLLKLIYKKNVKRITGNDLFEVLLKISDEQKLKVALIGSSGSVQVKLRNKVETNYPNLAVVMSDSPPLNFENDQTENEKTVSKLIEAEPDVIFAALGSPRQEIWLNGIKDRAGAKIIIGVGAVFDFYTGVKKRSPIFLQRLGLEWTWRLISEPSRLFKRYVINDFPFLVKQIKRILSERRNTGK